MCSLCEWDTLSKDMSGTARLKPQHTSTDAVQVSIEDEVNEVLAQNEPVVDPQAIVVSCQKCGNRTDWRRSTALLKRTYCSAMCESADLGFDMKKATS